MAHRKLDKAKLDLAKLDMAKLDMGRAWVQATGMIGANRDLVGVLAGLFLFIPMFVIVYALFTSGIDLSGGGGGQPNPERVAAEVNAFLVANWWALLLAIIGQLCGSIAILALLGDPDRPTVREALGMVPRMFLPVLGVQVLVGVLTQLPSFLAGLLPEVVAGALGLVVLPLTIYLTIKFTLTTAMVVLGHQRNPIEAMRGSWLLTKGNSLRLFGFFAMLLLLAAVIGLILLLVIGLVLSAAGERAALIGNAAIFALLLTVFYTMSFALTASIYRQLTHSLPDEEADLFA
jgi:hypothetical protein